MTLREAYRVFDLPPTAQWADVKQAYRRRAWQSHPDRFGHGTAAYHAAEKRFKRVNQAYERLRAASKQRRRPAGSNSASSGASGVQCTAPARTVRAPVAAASPVDTSPVDTTPADTAAASPHNMNAMNPFVGVPPGWMRVLSVTGSVGAFCLGVLWSDSLAGMLAWTAFWTVFAVGVCSLSACARS